MGTIYKLGMEFMVEGIWGFGDDGDGDVLGLSPARYPQRVKQSRTKKEG
jgi:hypothetical protein